MGHIMFLMILRYVRKENKFPLQIKGLLITFSWRFRNTEDILNVKCSSEKKGICIV